MYFNNKLKIMYACVPQKSKICIGYDETRAHVKEYRENHAKFGQRIIP